MFYQRRSKQNSKRLMHSNSKSLKICKPLGLLSRFTCSRSRLNHAKRILVTFAVLCAFVVSQATVEFVSSNGQESICKTTNLTSSLFRMYWNSLRLYLRMRPFWTIRLRDIPFKNALPVESSIVDVKLRLEHLIELCSFKVKNLQSCLKHMTESINLLKK